MCIKKFKLVKCLQNYFYNSDTTKLIIKSTLVPLSVKIVDFNKHKTKINNNKSVIK
ncbi:hypothetical protein FACS1894169_03720 [Bacteroidia bacterium]|nr:hypothetical protein FACS1894169_03720 [Bacteroidia bacterium]